MLDMFTGKGAPLSRTGFGTADTILGGDSAALWSILTVETRGFGFLQDKRPKILFERHIFAKRTSNRYNAGHPDISNPVRGGYSPTGAGEYDRLARAMVLDRAAALESASWGLGQIMGFNARSIGYVSAEDMIAHFKEDEDSQLGATANFIAANPPLAQAFKAKNWPRVAFYYNGPDYAANGYDTKLDTNYSDYLVKEPDLDLRAAQARLNYLGYNTKGVDGRLGGYTVSALTSFQRANNLTINGALDTPTSQSLIKAAGV